MNSISQRLGWKLPQITDPTLYHYCSGSTLIAVAEHSRVRACDLRKMNDYMEFEWGRSVFSDAAKLVVDQTSTDFIAQVTEHVDASRNYMLPIAACFSRKGDVLSQWRAYADDGAGFAVGFKTEALRKFPGNLFPVLYDRGRQLELMRSHLVAEFGRWSKIGKDEDKEEEINNIGTVLAADICLFKNPAFAEEEEVRLVYLLNIWEEDGANPSLKDPNAEGDLIPEHNVSYLCRNGEIVPHCDLKGTEAQPFSNIVIGPKSGSTLLDVKVLLSAFGHRDTEVVKSSASYR